MLYENSRDHARNMLRKCKHLVRIPEVRAATAVRSHSDLIVTESWARGIERPSVRERLFLVTLASALLGSAGVFGYLWCAWDFAFTGLSFGPSVPVERGAYGFLRHPMYFSLIAVLCGESLFFKSWKLLEYASVCALLAHIFVLLYEEPQMVKKWGTSYLQYAKRVPR